MSATSWQHLFSFIIQHVTSICAQESVYQSLAPLREQLVWSSCDLLAACTD